MAIVKHAFNCLVSDDPAAAAAGQVTPSHWNEEHSIVLEADENFVTDAEKVVLANTSGNNTGDQDLSGLVPATRTINSKPLTANITLTSTDVGADPAGTAATLVEALLSAPPETLDTLNELAAALGDDPNFATTVLNALSGKQPLDATLSALAALATAANKLIYATGSDQFATTDFTAFARTLLAVADAAAGRAALAAAADSEVVKLTGDQAVAGNKTFSGTVVAKQLIITNDGTAADVNNIGTPGGRGFGVGICPGPLPSGMVPISSGTFDKFHDDYGNYIYTDGSIMCWIPAYYYKWGTGSNGLSVNAVSIQPLSAYADEATANAAGYALDRAFYDGGVAQKGVFVDKFQCSNNGGVASSIRNGNPLSSNSAHNPFSGLTGAPANYYYGAIAAAKTRGSSFFCNSRFIFAMLARLAYAHAQASTSTTYCGWYHATNNFPKGCNNNALRDVNDTSVIYVSDGYSTCGKTGSANYFNRTTHNGQNSGVADLNGNMWEVTPGLTSDGTNLYILNTSVAMKNVTGGNTLATDLWGATGIAALYTSLGTTYQSLTDSDTVKYYGSTSQVFSAATSGNDWAAAGLGIPLLAGTSGTNAFGNDYLGDYAPSGRNELCPISGGLWSNSSSAGVWAFNLYYVRGNSNSTVGFRSALYL